jgi:hypothetical protein
VTNASTSLTTCTPTPEQREVLELYAIGYRWYTASRKKDIPDRTLANWLEQPGFRELGEQMRSEIALTALPMYGAICERAQRVLLRVKVADDDGDLAPTDPVVLWAERILKETLWPVLLARGTAS